jgi:hypothetical protein
MPLLTNNLPEMPTCATIIRPPIGEGDCTNFPTFEALVAAQMAAAHGATIRNGEAYAILPVDDIETECEAT